MQNRQRGFSLIEVLVALMILGISLGAIFQALSSSRRISLKADETLQAVRLAGNLLANPALINTVLKDRKIAARIDEETGWRYTLSALPLEMDTGNKRDVFQVPAMFELTLCLFHETDLREKAFCTKQWVRQ
ncbi:MAG: type II secretion system protein [Deltaproteobacteria bacterium]|nr:type II secretion system protein [Deltaproteobacteria bacterium]